MMLIFLLSTLSVFLRRRSLSLLAPFACTISFLVPLSLISSIHLYLISSLLPRPSRTVCIPPCPPGAQTPPLPQYPMRLSVADLAPDMSNVSIYGQVISVSVRDATLPIALRHPTTASSVSGMQHASFLEPQSRSLLSQHQQDQRRQHQTASGSHDPRGGDTRVVELGIRDAGGEARIFCCGRDAALDALRSR